MCKYNRYKAKPQLATHTLKQPNTFQYINNNHTSDDDICESDHFAPCTCIGASCNSLGTNCLCINNSSGWIYDDQGRLVNVNPYSDNLRFLQECNFLCSCSESCRNRNVQHGVTRHLVVFDTTTSKGLGVRAGELIPQYAFVCEYAGQARTATADDLEKPNEDPGSFNYILYVNEIFGDKKMTTIIDATKKGNVSRLINHSCDPNLFMVPVRVNNLIPHVALFALRDIEMGEELSYTYSGNLSSHQQNYSVKPCLCGSVNCKLFLPL